MAQAKGGGAASAAAGKGAASAASKGAASAAPAADESFGAGFANIKAHGTDHAGHGELQAKAFTGGKTVHFGGSAADSAGTKLAAHEATHVVQQKSAAPVQR